MSIVVVVKKEKKIVIASDSLTSQGNIGVSSQYKNNNEKIIQINDNYIGSVGKAMFKQLLFHAFKTLPDIPKLDSIENIYGATHQLHKLLKDEYFLTQSKSEQTVELSKFTLLLANSSGIYGISQDRHISDYSKFWAIGSGSHLALGAMHNAYEDKTKSASDIAEIAIKAACEFDKACGLPMHLHSIDYRPTKDRKKKS
jgi:ATP-dependent protease HslVU (ClpYQ) peptidase subunit